MKRLFLIIICLLSTLYTYTQNYTTPIEDTLSNPDDFFKNEIIEEMDNTLNLWYIERQLANSNAKTLVDDSLATMYNDSVVIKRLKNLPTVIPLSYNQIVKQWIELYVCKRKRSSSAMLGLAQYYYPWMQEIFDKYDVPEELIYLTIIESGLNPIAVSRAGATGIWQFMYQTGKIYGLEENTFVDDRRDPYKATDAAARHLRDLYNMFDDWGLAIAAYNSGPGNVRKAIVRSGNKRDFWGIKPYLPRETQNYFPLYIAALYLANFHNEHGIPAAELTIPFAVDTVMVNKELHLGQVAAVLNIDIEELKILNPQYKKQIIPAYTKAYPIRLKMTDIESFIKLQDSIYKFAHDSFFMPVKVYESMFTGKPLASGSSEKIYYYVKSGDNLSKIANKYGLSVSELKKMNKLSSNYIRVKQRLLVGYKYKEPEKKEVIIKDTTSTLDSTQTISPTDSTQVVVKQDSTITTKATPPATHQSKEKIYYVKKGDTLLKIATKYNTTTKKLANHNKIKNINSLKVGQKIIIP